MGTESTFEDDPEFLDDTLCADLYAPWLVAIDNLRKRHPEPRPVGASDDRCNRLEYTLVTKRGVSAHLEFSGETSVLLSPAQSGIFFDSITLSAAPSATETKEEEVDQEREADDFHDSDDEDLYDLYLAVDGEQTKDGLLDKSRLDQLTPDEAEILNAPRLRQIWDHTATGCPECKEIIRTLNIIRNALREEVNEKTTAPKNIVAVDRSNLR